MRTGYVFTAFAVVFALVLIKAHVHRSLSDSLPISGPYFVWKAWGVSRGDLVEICPPLDAAREAYQRHYTEIGNCPGKVLPFLKLVAAVGGDSVNLTATGVYVNGKLLPHSKRLERDSNGKHVALRPYGTQRLANDSIWLYGTSLRSFDSRYFGPVSLATIQYHAWAPMVSSKLPDLR